jgi:hypothetical protein
LVSFKECSQVLKERSERVVVEESGLGGQEMGISVFQPVQARDGKRSDQSSIWSIEESYVGV